ncbi:MAG: AAA family ATPase [bacterium]|nr:AAA family ATPase [bacterium]
MRDEKQESFWIPGHHFQTTRSLEKQFLLSLIQTPEGMKEAYGVIQEKDLMTLEVRKIYKKILEYYEKQESWNVIILKSDFSDPSYTDYIFGVSEVIGITAFRQLVKQLKQNAVRRDIYNYLERNYQTLWEKDPSVFSTQILSFFSKIDLSLSQTEEWHLDELLKTYQQLMDSRVQGITTGITTGFDDLDYLLGQGLQKKDLAVVGARPSVGKTSFSLSLAYNAAKAGSKVLFVTLEMDANEILDRLVAFQTGLPVTQLIRGKVDKKVIEKGIIELNKIPLSILYLPRATSGDIYAAASKHKHMEGLDLLIVDYLGYLSDTGDDEVLRLGRISKNLKTTANLLDCGLIVPHQLSRKIEQRSQEKREMPLLSDLRDSGHIEQDADIVLFLNRDILGDTSSKTTLRIGKNRTGETGILDLKFNSLTTRFEKSSGFN